MRNWTSQIVIGIIVTVVGTVIANAIIGGKGRHVSSAAAISPARLAAAAKEIIPGLVPGTSIQAACSAVCGWTDPDDPQNKSEGRQAPG